MRNYYTKNVKFCFLFQDQHCCRVVALHNTLVRGMRHALCSLGYEVWVMGYGEEDLQNRKTVPHNLHNLHNKVIPGAFNIC
jgi:hypothetical protein